MAKTPPFVFSDGQKFSGLKERALAVQEQLKRTQIGMIVACTLLDEPIKAQEAARRANAVVNKQFGDDGAISPMQAGKIRLNAQQVTEAIVQAEAAATAPNMLVATQKQRVPLMLPNLTALEQSWLELTPQKVLNRTPQGMFINLMLQNSRTKSDLTVEEMCIRVNRVFGTEYGVEIESLLTNPKAIGSQVGQFARIAQDEQNAEIQRPNLCRDVTDIVCLVSNVVAKNGIGATAAAFGRVTASNFVKAAESRDKNWRQGVLQATGIAADIAKLSSTAARMAMNRASNDVAATQNYVTEAANSFAATQPTKVMQAVSSLRFAFGR